MRVDHARVTRSWPGSGLLARVRRRWPARDQVNPVSAVHHDNLFVPYDRAEDALAALRELSGRAAAAAVPVGGYELDDDPARVDRDVVWRFLSTEAYWSGWRTRSDVETQLDRAWRVVGAYRRSTGEMVGFARAVSDGVSFGYLSDVFVLDGARGAGSGGPGRGSPTTPGALGVFPTTRTASTSGSASRHLHGPAGPVQLVAQPPRGGRPEPQHVVGAQHALGVEGRLRRLLARSPARRPRVGGLTSVGHAPARDRPVRWATCW